MASTPNKGLTIGFSIGLVFFFLIAAGAASIIIRSREKKRKSIAELVGERFELNVDIAEPSHNTKTVQRESANLSKEY